MGIFLFLIIILLFWGVVSGNRGAGFCLGNNCHGGHDKSTEDKSLAILNERYAKGDISKEEYEEKKKALLG